MGRTGKGGGKRDNDTRKRYEGNNGSRGFTAKHKDLLDEIIAERDKEKDDRLRKKEMARMEARLRKDLGAPPTKKASSKEDYSDLDSDDTDSLSDWSDAGFGLSTRSSQRKCKKMKLRIKQMAKENKELEKKAKEYEAMQNKVTEHLVTPPKGAGGGKDASQDEPKMTMQQWMSMQHQVHKEFSTSRPRGLFDEDVARESEGSGSSVESPVSILGATLEEKLKVADLVAPIRNGVKVSAQTEKSIKAVANSVAERYFNGTFQEQAREVLEELKSKFELATSAKQANTLLLAILRACISRGQNFTDKDLGLSSFPLN